MTKTPLSQRLADIIAPAVATLDVAFWGVEIASAGSRMLLRVYIEAPAADAAQNPTDADAEAGPAGVTVDRCARVSRHLGALFDAEDLIPGAYVLEVSSPGLERRFFSPEQMAAYLGRQVDVRLNIPQDGRRHLRGALSAVEGDTIAVAEDAGTVRVRWELIKGAHLVHEFPAAQKPD